MNSKYTNVTTYVSIIAVSSVFLVGWLREFQVLTAGPEQVVKLDPITPLGHDQSIQQHKHQGYDQPVHHPIDEQQVEKNEHCLGRREKDVEHS